jgi:hypothetical protein
MRRLAIISLCLLLGLTLSSLAFAASTQYFAITNNSGASRSDLHLEFTGTGGTATLTVIGNPAGCGAPIVTNPGTPWDITWSGACVDVGEVVTVRIDSDFSVAFDSGYWTPGNVALAGGDVAEQNPVPACSPWAVGVLVLTVLAAALLLIFRRRRVETA